MLEIVPGISRPSSGDDGGFSRSSGGDRVVDCAGFNEACRPADGRTLINCSLGASRREIRSLLLHLVATMVVSRP